MTEHLLVRPIPRGHRDAQHQPRTATNASFPEGHGVNAHEIGPGVVRKDANVTVTAFATKHAMESYGYRFETPDRNDRRLR